jgi:hypothetical protein
MTKHADLINKDTLAKMRATFADLPPKPKSAFTRREAIAEMANEIRRARDELGYSLEDIAQMLAGHGHAIKPATLRGYLSDLSKDKSAGRTKRKKKTASAAPVAAERQTGEMGRPDALIFGAAVTSET